MYISTFTPLQTALSGIEAAQQELDTTGNNISNENTAGYTEESVNLGESPPLTIASIDGAGEQIGTGVTVESVTSARNVFIDTAARTQSAIAANASTEQSYLNQVQSALGAPTGGIATQLSTFWNDWNTLANNPTSTAAKQAVVNDGATLAQSINQLSSDLSSVQAQASSQYSTITGTGGQLQNDANQIAQLNQAIKQAQAAGEDPNQLEDERGKALDDLSTLGNVAVTNNSDGTVTVNFGDAASPLVNGTTVNWPQTITAATGGTLGALLSLTGTATQTGQIDQYLSGLDNVAQSLANEVNNPTVNGTTEATNPPFFTYTASATPGVPSSTLAVNPALVMNPASVQTTDTTNVGDNDVALAIAGLSGGTADQAYDAFVSGIGSDTQAAGTNATTQQSLATAINNQRQSVEGVSLPQEEADVIQEQQAYQASAQIMNAFNTMINSLLTQVGAG